MLQDAQHRALTNSHHSGLISQHTFTCISECCEIVKHFFFSITISIFFHVYKALKFSEITLHLLDSVGWVWLEMLCNLIIQSAEDAATFFWGPQKLWWLCDQFKCCLVMLALQKTKSNSYSLTSFTSILKVLYPVESLPIQWNLTLDQYNLWENTHSDRLTTGYLGLNYGWFSALSSELA